MPVTTKEVKALVRRMEMLKDEAETARREADQAKGALDQIQQRMEEDFGCSTREEADKMLVKLDKQTEALFADVQKEEEAYQQEFGGKVRDA